MRWHFQVGGIRFKYNVLSVFASCGFVGSVVNPYVWLGEWVR